VLRCLALQRLPDATFACTMCSGAVIALRGFAAFAEAVLSTSDDADDAVPSAVASTLKKTQQKRSTAASAAGSTSQVTAADSEDPVVTTHVCGDADLQAVYSLLDSLEVRRVWRRVCMLRADSRACVVCSWQTEAGIALLKVSKKAREEVSRLYHMLPRHGLYTYVAPPDDDDYPVCGAVWWLCVV
jgi:hypothetical protein